VVAVEDIVAVDTVDGVVEVTVVILVEDMAVILVVDMEDIVVEDTVVILVVIPVVEVDEDIVLTQQDLTVTAMTMVNGIRIGIINGANHWNQSGITRSQKRSQNGKTSVMVIGIVHQNGISHQLGIDGQSGMMLLQTGTLILMAQMMAIGTMLHTMDQVLMIMTVQVDGDQNLKI